MIYAIKGANNKVKIGYTKHDKMKKRFKETNEGFEVLAFGPGSLRQEKLIHGLLRNELKEKSGHSSGEWYDKTAVIQTVVGHINRSDLNSGIALLNKWAIRESYIIENPVSKLTEAPKKPKYVVRGKERPDVYAIAILYLCSGMSPDFAIEAVSNGFGKAIKKHGKMPEGLTKRIIERRITRNEGCSQKLAKLIISGGFNKVLKVQKKEYEIEAPQYHGANLP